MSRYNVLKGFYNIERSIGSGGFAKVKLATHLLTKEKVAIKIMEKNGLGDDLPRVTLELEALKNLSHQNICKLYEVIETETHFYLILEYCSGGELFDHIVQKNRLGERESRRFFREIVSAVAYLHDKGYAHRDLKPENVLLDKDHKLKLIDFGLCARPMPGLESFLFTSCGSPTYAAPELISGQKYLGPEVDIWSLGILLYALLCGVLPFDDTNIEGLYKKILSGRYEEPLWLSSESKRLIRSMLQTDPKKRITIEKLLCHPWLMLGYSEPVNKYCIDEFQKKDLQCVNIMAQYYGIPSEAMWSRINSWSYDYDTSTYMLLMSRKHRGLPVKLARVPLKARLASDAGNRMECSPNIKSHQSNLTYTKISSNPGTPERDIDAPFYDIRTTYLILNGKESTPDRELCNMGVASLETSNVKKAVVNTEQENSSRFLEPPVVLRKPHKRLWSPGPDESPAAAKTPRRDLEYPSDRECGYTERTPSLDSGKGSSSSGGDSLGSGKGIGSGKKGAGSGSGSGSGSRARSSPRCGATVFGSIERRFHRVRHLLTPRRARAAAAAGFEPTPTRPRDTPQLLSGKEVCNVSTASSNNPELVLEELKKALVKMGIVCTQKGFTLRGKLDSSAVAGAGGAEAGARATPVTSRLSFELEVCLVAVPGSEAPAHVGVRRKRLKGDAWSYKRIVEQVLAMARP